MSLWGGSGAWGSIVDYLRRVATHTIPSKTATYDLGSSSKRWKTLYYTTLDPAIAESIAHADLSDMPDTGGTNTNHDARYALKARTISTTSPLSGGGDLSADRTLTVGSASDSATGVVELATITETDTGTDTGRAVTPDGLAGSIHGKKIVYLKVLANATALTTGDGKMYFTVPSDLNGMNLVDADASVYTVSSSGTPTVAIYNVTDSQDMLSTSITIDANEYSSYTASTAPAINTSYDDVATGDIIRIDVDVAGTGTKGLDVILVFQLP